MFSGHYPQKDNFGFFEAQLKKVGNRAVSVRQSNIMTTYMIIDTNKITT